MVAINCYLWPRNSNAKYSVLSVKILFDIGLRPVSPIPQLLQLWHGLDLVAVVSKIVDDFHFASVISVIDDDIDIIQAPVKIGTIAQGLVLIRYFGLNVVQYDDMLVSVDVDDKLMATECHPLSRFWHRNYSPAFGSLERKIFASFNLLVGL